MKALEQDLALQVLVLEERPELEVEVLDLEEPDRVRMSWYSEPTPLLL